MNGWKLVPVRHQGRAGLTDSMMRAFYKAFDANSQRGDFERLNAGYNAMIEAAPEAPVDAADGSVAQVFAVTGSGSLDLQGNMGATITNSDLQRVMPERVTPEEYAEYFCGAREHGLKPYTFLEYCEKSSKVSNQEEPAQRGMSLAVALDFADNPRPYPSLAAPADTNSELYRALKTLADAYRSMVITEAPIQHSDELTQRTESEKAAYLEGVKEGRMQAVRDKLTRADVGLK